MISQSGVPAGIFGYWIRYGRSESLAQFGTVHPLSVARGDRVIVATPFGLLPGCVVTSSADSPRAFVSWNPVGELLRVMTEEDQLAVDLTISSSAKFMERVQLEVQKAHSSLVITSWDLDLEQTLLRVFFVGNSSPAIGRLAVELGREFHPCQVQFVPEPLATASVGAAEEIEPASEPLSTRQAAKTNTVSATGRERIEVDQGRSLHAQRHSQVDRFDKTTSMLIQSHGIYQQKIREQSNFRCMVRLRTGSLPLSKTQLMKLGELSARYGDGRLRPTVRQGWQIYGVQKENLLPLLQGLDELNLPTLGSCGNVVRNVTCCALAKHGNQTDRTLFQLAREIDQHVFLDDPWYEIIWLNNSGEAIDQRDYSSVSKHQGVYGNSLLPHKLKIAVTTYQHDCTESVANDIALVLHENDHGGTSVDFWIGGSLGFKQDKVESFACLAKPWLRVNLEDCLIVLQGMIKAYQELAPRTARGRSRLKYWLAAIGMETFTELVQGRLARQVQWHSYMPIPWGKCEMHRGKTLTRSGITAHVLAMPIGGFSTAEPQVNERHERSRAWQALMEFPFREATLTTTHELVLVGAPSSNPDWVKKWSDLWPDCSFEDAHRIPEERFTTISCPALPTCSQAVSHAELHHPQLRQWLKEVIEEQQIQSGDFRVRISGCSNGCSRPLLAHLGLIAVGADRYQWFIGGNPHRDQLALAVGPVRNWGEIIRDDMEKLILGIDQSTDNSLTLQEKCEAKRAQEWRNLFSNHGRER